MAGAPHGWMMRQGPWAPAAADLLVCLGVMAFSLVAFIMPSERHHGPVTALAVALAVLATAPLAARRARPLTVLAVAAVAEGLYLATSPLNSPGGALGLAVALYTVASSGERRATLRLASVIAGAAGLILLVDITLGRANTGPAFLFVSALVVGSWSLGDNVRTRRAYLAQLEERARRLDAEREENARRAVQEERARIARELHDVVAHHVSAIAVQAGVGVTIARRQPERAYEALSFIQEASRLALTEMRALLIVLRGEGEGEAERAPQPSLAQVAQLVGHSRAAGLSVTLEVQGDARVLPEALDLSAYRIVQEALTNSLKHGGRAQARVLVRYADDALELEISDRGGRGRPGPPEEGAGGRGLIGMRERVALFGGDLVAGPTPDRGFRVLARLPWAARPR